MKLISYLAATVLTCLAAIGSLAHSQIVSTKLIGATFIEPPPGRDKSLVPFAAGSNQEKIEVYVVLSSRERFFLDTPGFGRDQSISVTGMLANKTMVPVGTADVTSFAKLSADKRHMTVTMGVTRLPDNVPVAVNFAGTLQVRVARGKSQKSTALNPKVGSTLDFGIGDVKVAGVERGNLSIAGGAGIERIESMRFVSLDGRTTPMERTTWGRVNDRFDVNYTLPPGQTAGKLEVTLHEGLEIINVPVKFTVTRPY
jgi:hypothetical protein